ncbi:tetratricopeptide repeat protein [Zoogloea sp.]|uniref:tetratricopeptide repeat protein n=1 Tax=Zoogloea sp. TaxID=49181 RepID=UPI001416B56F|nr:MAG: tetratricopeptide repeat protein [Zoogloea sp.]
MKPIFRAALSPRLLAVLLSAGLLAGAARAQQPPAEEEVQAGGPATVYPAQELTPQIIYQMLLAEIAAARSQPVMAARSYIDLAQRTRDARIARRAAEIALFARQAELAGEAARLWLDLEPASVQAQQLVSGTLVNQARFDELETQLAATLARQGDNIGPALMSLNRGLARIPDKDLIRRLVTQLTEPYLQQPEAHFARANAAFVAGDSAAAAVALDDALRLRPDWEQAVILKAQFQQEAAPGSGIQTLQDYLGAHPEAREVRSALARLLVGARQFGPARQHFEALLKGAPDDKDLLHAAGLLALQAGDGVVAEAHFRRLLALGFAEADTLRMYLGQIAEDARRPDDAIGWYKEIAPGARYAAAQGKVAQLLAARGHLAEARQLLQERAREAAPAERSQYVLGEAQLLRDAGRDEEAFDVLDAALLANPDSPDYLYESALMAERLGRPEVMEGRLRKLIALKPDHAHAYNALGYSLVERNLRLDEAEALIRKALELAPNDPFIVDSLGWVLYRKGDLGGALERLRTAYETRPDPEIAAHLGEVLWMLGRRDEAARTWKDAAREHPGNAVLGEVIKKFKP